MEFIKAVFSRFITYAILYLVSSLILVIFVIFVIITWNILGCLFQFDGLSLSGALFFLIKWDIFVLWLILICAFVKEMGEFVPTNNDESNNYLPIKKTKKRIKPGVWYEFKK
jgi:hypothetical protein